MRNLNVFLLIILFAGTSVSAQVKIGDNPQNIDPSSVLELESTDKVLVITRVTTAQMNAIVPSQGALCFNTDLQSVHYYDGSQWVNLGGGSGTGGPLTADAIVNTQPTIVITPTATGDNLEVAPNSIRSEQIVDGGVNGIDIQDGSIGPGKLQDFSITEEKLSENSVGAFALDNDSFGVSAFNNDVGYITAADVTSVSTDAGNTIVAGSDGGAYYDDTNLLMDVMDNAADIAADNDQSPTNERQNLIFNAGTNILTLTTPATPGNQVDLSALAGGGGSTEEVDGITLRGAGTAADPFEITPSTTINQFLQTNATGDVVWSDLPPGGGTNQTAAEVPYDNSVSMLAATNTQAAIDEIVSGGLVNGQSITLDTSTNEIQLLDNDNTTVGSFVTLDGLTIEAIDNGTDNVIRLANDAVSTVKIIDGNVTPIKIAPSLTVNQVLTTTAAGAVWADLPPSGGSALFNANTISGSGVAGDEYTVADDGITTIKILDANVTAAKIAPGGADQILRTASDGLSVDWIDLPTGSAVITDATLTGDGSSATTALGIAPAPDLTPAADQMLITTDAGAIEWAQISGTENSVFYAGPNGLPTTADENANPLDDRGFFWDPNGRNLGGANQFGALYIGLEPGNAQSNAAKVHIADNFPGLTYSLHLQNFSGNTNRTTGVLFSTVNGSYGKGSLIFDSQGANGLGDFHFLQNNALDTSLPAITDKAFTVKNNKDIVIYGGIEVDGTGPGTGLGTNGQVLSSTGTGVQWINGGAGETNTAANIGTAGVGPYATKNGAELRFKNINAAASGIITVTDDTTNDEIDLDIADNSIMAAKLAADVAGAGITQNATTGALEVDTSTITGTGTVTGTGITVSGGTNATFANVALEITDDAITTAKILDDNVTAAKIAADVAGAGITQNATTGALEVDTSTLTGTGTVTGTGITVTGGTNATFANVGLEIANSAITADKIADGEVTMTKLAVGSVQGSFGGTSVIVPASIGQLDIGNNAIGSGEIQSGVVASDEITDDSIMNVDIAAGAAIAGTKVNPNFGTQDILTTGNVGGNVITAQGNLVTVTGSIFKGALDVHPDYVFQKYFLGNSSLKGDYRFQSLEEIEAFVKENHHLPGIKSASVVKAEGIWDLGASNLQNLEKIEELFLHTIEQEKKIKNLKSENDTLQKQVDQMKKDFEEIKKLLKDK